MKIAVSASSPELDSPVDPRFGRCPYFLIVDQETMEFEVAENPYIGASGGAGIQSAQLIAGKGVQAVLTGSCGPNAFHTLQAAGVKVVVGVTGTVREVVQNYGSGPGFTEAKGPDVPPHFGMGMSPAGGRGRGMGRGLGRAAGVPFGQSQRSFPGQRPDPVSPQDELELLKKQSQDLRRSLDLIAEKIADLEKNKK
jgi:predicted Fe-Mo cluster-binding NifX family protein